MSRSGDRKDRKVLSTVWSHPGLSHGLEEVVGVVEADAVTGADSGVAEGLGQEALADADGPHQEDVLVSGEELQGEDGVQEPVGRA